MKELKEFSSEEEYVPRSIQYIVVHCSATRANIPFTEEQLLKCHLQRGFKYIGYHFYITRDGELHHCRPDWMKMDTRQTLGPRRSVLHYSIC